MARCAVCSAVPRPASSCAERAWCDFVSFDDRLPERMQLHVARVMRDDTMLADIENEVTAFLRELHDTVAELEKRFT